MATPIPVNIPKPPNEKNVDELHRWAHSLYSFLDQNFGNGTQATFLSQSQLNQMVSANDLSQAGKVFMNHDTGKVNVTTVVGGTLTLQVL